MPMTHLPSGGRRALAFALTLALAAGCPKVEPGYLLTDSDRELLAGADARIEEHRKAMATLQVVAADGGPVSGAAVDFAQEEHEFLFGFHYDQKTQAVIASHRYGTALPAEYKSFDLPGAALDALNARFLELGNSMTIEVGWSYYEPEQGRIAYPAYDGELQRYGEQGIKVRAQSLVWDWGAQRPVWAPTSCPELEQALDERVAAFLDRYRGRLASVIVQNEAARPFRVGVDQAMSACMKERGVVAFVAQRFRVARAADAGIPLMINECCGIDDVDAGFPALLDGLSESGQLLFDVIGIQSHMHSGYWPLTDVWAIADGYSARYHRPVHFTEITVLSGTPSTGAGDTWGRATTPDGERAQADYVEHLFTILFSHPGVEATTWWNLSDHGAWKAAPAGLLREDLGPKPAFERLRGLIKERWWTRGTTQTSVAGAASMRGFFGRYRVTVTPPGGTAREFQLDLRRQGPRDFTLQL